MGCRESGPIRCKRVRKRPGGPSSRSCWTVLRASQSEMNGVACRMTIDTRDAWSSWGNGAERLALIHTDDR